ncbi:hybrid sensor histidine kinase/response regulator [Ramlibacter sp. MMS24-I3-19]|uniref:hybrid sensor histidine kinase/response regulator n=1 Tax=Ramlibacter sp. MMS24-I3-19 TaxID=3416606 RepID=UPI003D036FC9
MTPPPKPHPLLLGDSGTPGAASPTTARLLDDIDWSETPLGPPQQWPQSLRIAVSICLNSRFPMFVWWGPSLVNIYNDAYIPILGKKHPRAFGRPARESWSDIWDVLGPQVDTVMNQGRATWNERVLLQMERNGYPEDTWFTWSYSPIHDDQGGIGGLFCACTEETPAVLAERERDRLVREAQDTARTLETWFDHAPGFVALLRGRDLVFEMVNEAYYQLVGHRDIEGRPAFEALPEMRHQGFEEILGRVYDTGEPFIGRGLPLSVQRDAAATPQERFIDFIYQPVRNADGQVGGIFVQGYDVTDQVLAVKALRDDDRRKDEFLATLAHELRNPLAPIRQAAAVARSPAADTQRRTWALDVIERQASHMALLLDDLLDISRISRGRLVLRLEPVELREVVHSALETVRPLVERKNHILDVKLPAQPLRLNVDAMRLAQVLSNLLSNAAKYTDEGGRIELVAGQEGDEVVIRVRDNGIGLEPRALAEIFEMFSQVSSALDRAEGGLGIGLSLSRGLVGLHGGTLQADSAGPGEGSEFTVRLPGSVVVGASAKQPDLSPPAAARAGRLILVADDNPDALQTMGALLEIEGHRVELAANGEQALAAAQALKPEVAVLDIGMPGLNGYEVARRIRAQPWGADIRLIALTGWGQAEDVERAHAAGFDHHVTKPVDLDALQELVGA